MSSDPQRRLILHMSVSLDGFSAAGRDIPGSVDHRGVRHQANLEMIGQVGLIAIGRGAYEEMAQAWATSDSPMAHLINALPKVVFSTSLAAVDWDNAVLNEGTVERKSQGSRPSRAATSSCLGAHASRTASSAIAWSTSTGSPSTRSPSAAAAP
jgi:hypothetical protein